MDYIIAIGFIAGMAGMIAALLRRWFFWICRISRIQKGGMICNQ